MRKIKVLTDTATEFELSDTAADIQRKRTEREQKDREEKAQKQQRQEKEREEARREEAAQTSKNCYLRTGRSDSEKNT